MLEGSECSQHAAGGELARLRVDLLDVLARLDLLELHDVGADVAMAVHRLESAHLGLIHLPFEEREPS